MQTHLGPPSLPLSPKSLLSPPSSLLCLSSIVTLLFSLSNSIIQCLFPFIWSSFFYLWQSTETRLLNIVFFKEFKLCIYYPLFSIALILSLIFKNFFKSFDFHFIYFCHYCLRCPLCFQQCSFSLGLLINFTSKRSFLFSFF